MDAVFWQSQISFICIMCCMLYIFKTRAQDACDSTSLLLLINLLLFNWKVLLRIKLSQVCLACVIQLKTMWQVKKLSNFCYCLDTILCSLKLNNSDLVMICGYIGFNGYNVFSLFCEFMSQQCQKQENPLRVKIYYFSYNLKDFKFVLSL